MIKFFSVIFSLKLFALIPLESLVLGDLSEEYKKEATDPLNYIFTFKGKYKVEQKRALAIFRGFVDEGENLSNLCKVNYQLNYANYTEKEEVKRTMVATLQYIGLDILTRALAKYAKFFEFTKEEYANLTDSLVGNFCSKNISVISVRQLRKNMIFTFLNTNNFQLPDVRDNLLFPKKLEEINAIDNVLEKEFIQTVKLFRALCSWGNDIENYRLLVPILKNSVLMAFVIRQLSNQNFSWDTVNNQISWKSDFTTDQVLCKGLICRKTDREIFQKELPRALGSRSIKEDLQQVYCSEFSKLNFKTLEQEPKIKELIQNERGKGSNLMVGQFLALLTGIPDFFVRANKFSDGRKFLKFALEEDWDNWARDQNKSFEKNLFFEEPLWFEVVPREYYFHSFLPNFKVSIDIKMGEFDKVTDMVGTIKVFFNLKLYKSYLSYLRSEWLGVNRMTVQDRRDKILDNFILTIYDQVQNARLKFKIPPWSGNLERIIALELLDQFREYQGNYFIDAKDVLVKIPVELNYSPMALKYIYFKKIVSQNFPKSK